MARKTDYAHVMGIIFSSELCSETDFVCLLKHELLKLNITESTSCLITSSRKGVIIFG